MSDTTIAQQNVDQQTDAPMLSIVDLQQILNIIDLASSRGAFRGAELASVGISYNRVQAFVQFTTAVQPAESA
jgi:hypothetical protein